MWNLKLEIQELWVLKILVHCSIIQVKQFERATSNNKNILFKPSSYAPNFFRFYVMSEQ